MDNSVYEFGEESRTSRETSLAWPASSEYELFKKSRGARMLCPISIKTIISAYRLFCDVSFLEV